MSNQGFKPRKLHGSLSTKLKKFQELYEEIMEVIQVKPSVKTELQSLSPRTFTRLVEQNFEESSTEEPPKRTLYSDIT
jgi:chaperonin cofactor prefoldin